MLHPFSTLGYSINLVLISKLNIKNFDIYNLLAFNMHRIEEQKGYMDAFFRQYRNREKPNFTE